MKIYIDDVRIPCEYPYDKTWVVVRTSKDAIKLIAENINIITDISFDHDLGMINGVEDTTIPVANFLEKMAYDKLLPKGIELWVHSANPVGRINLGLIFKSIERFLTKY